MNYKIEEFDDEILITFNDEVVVTIAKAWGTDEFQQRLAAAILAMLIFGGHEL